jgi:ElaB/YqjD/DUF883 family membrane-anchored ribosome-binding protein
MDHEAEVIKSQMEETRSSLAEKLETLENQVVGTVQQTTAAVSNTVEAVKDTVESVKDAVEETMEKAKDSVHDTVETIQESLNLPHQVQRHPWGMFTGSVALGVLTGYLLPAGRRRPRSYRYQAPSGDGFSARRSNLSEEFLHETSAGYTPGAAEPAAAPPPQPSTFSKVGGVLGSELDKLKGLAIGTALGLVRDLVVDRLPETMRPDLTNMVNEVTEKLGGKVLPSPVLGQFQSHEPASSETRFTQSTPSSFNG